MRTLLSFAAVSGLGCLTLAAPPYPTSQVIERVEFDFTTHRRLAAGSDNWPVEVAPNPDPQISLPIHQIMLVINGIHLLENLKLDELATKKVYEFAFVMQPLKLRGFTGSTVAPTAFR